MKYDFFRVCFTATMKKSNLIQMNNSSELNMAFLHPES